MYSSDPLRDSLLHRIYNINEKTFDTVAKDVFHYQVERNPIYKSHCHLIGVDKSGVRTSSFPFLPISMFRDHEIRSGQWEAEMIFRSSGTTDVSKSKHLVRQLDWYHQVAKKCFQFFYESPLFYSWVALLPSYLERPDSSLVSMVQSFMSSPGDYDGFYSSIDGSLVHKLDILCRQNKPTILIGVSYALLDLFENNDVQNRENLIVIETGGMKGRGAEITREELHARLKLKQHSLRVHSEYGMTELFSQAYMPEKYFIPSPTMKVMARDISDPLKILAHGQRGGINVIDLANLDTCSFIATDDVGVIHEQGKFEIIGRLDQSDIRGCNLLYT